MRCTPLILVFCCGLSAVACGSESHSPGFQGNDAGTGGSGSSGGGGSGSGGSGSGSGGSLVGDGGTEGGSGNGCSGQAADYVYVLSVQNNLYRFAPNTKQFTLIGPVQCQTQLSPNSMAVDRNANAYVNYTGYDANNMPNAGVIYKVSTADASCSPQPVMTLPAGWYEPGMGYSTAGANSTVETLYIASTSGGQIGLVDFGKNTVGPIGSVTGMVSGQSCELTGTGDGRLFGYFTSTPVYLAQIDKTSGATPNAVPMTGVQTPQDYAFSFWGGHFYLYSSQGMGSSVADYDPSTGSINTSYIANVGFDIVGAGVSTCAPLTMPQ